MLVSIFPKAEFLILWSQVWRSFQILQNKEFLQTQVRRTRGSSMFMYILGFLAAGSHCIPRFWARLCANSCAMANGRPYYIWILWGEKKRKKNEYNGSSFCLTVHLLFHKVTVQAVTIVYAYRKNEHNEVPNRKNPPLLFWGEPCTLVNLQRTVCLVYTHVI